MSTVVDQDVLRFDRGILRSELLERVLEQPLGELHDVRLSRAVNAFAALGERERERELDDLLASFARDQLEALGHARRLHVLDAGVEIFDVLADDDDVELSPGKGGLNSGQLPNRPNVAVGLEEGAERDVGAAVSVSDGSLERTL